MKDSIVTNDTIERLLPDYVYSYQQDFIDFSYNSNNSLLGATYKTKEEWIASKRERVRFMIGEYQHLNLLLSDISNRNIEDKIRERANSVFSNKIFHNTCISFVFTQPNHFIHRSIKNPGIIAYTENSDKLVRDIQSRMKLGVYLTRFNSDWLTPEDISHIANIYKRKYTFNNILFAKTREEIKHVYMNGPGSCMSYTLSHYNTGGIHPTEAYASGDFSVAYVKDDDDRIIARCVVDEVNKQYVRAYGNTEALTPALVDDGYSLVSGFEDGLRFLQLKHYDKFIGPYVDGDNSEAFIKNKDYEYLYLGEGDECIGDFQWSNDNRGIIENMESNTEECSCCGDDTDIDDMNDSDDGNICSYCYENSYINTEDGYTVLPGNAFCTSDGNYYRRESAMRNAGYVRTEDDDWCPEEDVVLLEDGYYVQEDEACEVLNYNGDTVWVRKFEEFENEFSESLYINDSRYVEAYGVVNGNIVLDKSPESNCSKIEGSDTFIHEDTSYEVIRYVNESQVLINMEGFIFTVEGEFEENYEEQEHKDDKYELALAA